MLILNQLDLKLLMKIVAILDTHCRFHKLKIPQCDVLIDCGDYSTRGYLHETIEFYKWFNLQSARFKISVQGNHELGWDQDPEIHRKIALERCPDVILLENS